MKRFLVILIFIALSGLMAACDSKESIATVTARAQGTNVTNLTMTAVFGPGTLAPASNVSEPTAAPTTGEVPPATAIPTQAATTAMEGQPVTPTSRIVPRTAPATTQAPVATQAATAASTQAATQAVEAQPVTPTPRTVQRTITPAPATAVVTQAATSAPTQAATTAVEAQPVTPTPRTAQRTDTPAPATAAPTQSGATATPFNSVMATVYAAGTLTAVAPTATPTATVAKNANLDWFDTATIYSLYVRSFRDSNGDGIGDLKGVIDGLDYIQSLGVDTIWLLPVFKSPSVHGYDTVDYYTVNPDYGTNDDLLKLIQEVHKRKMHILLDYVVNHVSNQHPIFKDAYNNPQSKYSDYFTWGNDAHTQYTTFAGVQEMPKLNYANPDVVKFSTDIALYWLDPNKDGDTSDGVDGYRCDVANGPPPAFWAQLRSAMNKVNPRAALLGELWVQTPQDMKDYLGNGRLDAAFDYPLYIQMAGHWDRNGEGVFSGKGNPGVAFGLAQNGESLYPPGAKVVRFINNHDTNRVIGNVGGDVQRAKAAALFLYSNPGPIVIYYGEELGMKGDKCGPLDYDACRREPLDWWKSMKGTGQTSWFTSNTKPDDGISVEEEEQAGQDSILKFYRQLGRDRKRLIASAPLKMVNDSTNTLYIMKGTDGNITTSFLAINFSGQKQTLPAIGGDGCFGHLEKSGVTGDKTLTFAPGGYYFAVDIAAGCK